MHVGLRNATVDGPFVTGLRCIHKEVERTHARDERPFRIGRQRAIAPQAVATIANDGGDAGLVERVRAAGQIVVEILDGPACAGDANEFLVGRRRPVAVLRIGVRKQACSESGCSASTSALAVVSHVRTPGPSMMLTARSLSASPSMAVATGWRAENPGAISKRGCTLKHDLASSIDCRPVRTPPAVTPPMMPDVSALVSFDSVTPVATMTAEVRA